MGVPSGEIVARPMLPRACGCLCEFQHYAVDRYRAQRLAKFQSTRCPACVAKAEEERKASLAALPGKGEAIQALPNGTEIHLTRRPDGKWLGVLTAEGTTVEAVADWPQGLSGTLARQWAAARGITVSPAPDTPAPPAAAPPKPAPSKAPAPPAKK